MTTSEMMIATPHGEGRLVTRRSRKAVATLLLSHGAGAGIDTPDLEALDRNLPRHGITVARFEQPWHVAGMRLATPPVTLDAAFIAAADRMRVRTPLIIGGRSAGARSAVRTAKTLGAVGCLALAFPLHPEYRPEKTRVHELRQAGVPTLVVQGERDLMGKPESFPPDTDLVVVPGADHGFEVRKRDYHFLQSDAMDLIVEATLEWIVREIIGSAPDRPASRNAEPV